MSREKRPSWREGKVIFQTRVYISQAAMDGIKEMAKTEARDKANVVSRALERIFGSVGKAGSKP